MDKKYELIKSADFCGTPCDIYSDDNSEMFMTAFQLGSCLGYAEPRKAISKIVSRNEYLEKAEFSSVVKLETLDSKNRDVRIFTEDGIYEVTMLAKTEKAKEFRAFVRKLIKSIRKGKTQTSDYSKLSPQLQYLISLEQKTKELENRQDELETKLANSEKNRDELIKATFEFGRIGELQRKEIVKAVKKRAIEICRYADTYDRVGKSVISSIYNALQKHFDVKSYLDLSYNQYTDCMIFIQYFEPDQKLYIKILHEQPKIKLGNLFDMCAES